MTRGHSSQSSSLAWSNASGPAKQPDRRVLWDGGIVHTERGDNCSNACAATGWVVDSRRGPRGSGGHRDPIARAWGSMVSGTTENMFCNAQTSGNGIVTGEPRAPVRHTWLEVHERARRSAGGLAAAGVGHGDPVGVLAGAPVEIAPTAQGLWMRGASLTMLHQPTLRADLQVWAQDTITVIDMIKAKVVIVSDPFMAAAPVLAGRGIEVVTVEKLLSYAPIAPVDTGEEDLALLQLTSGSTGSPKAVSISPRNLVSNVE